METGVKIVQNAVITGFSNETFQEFVLEYYLTLPEIKDDISIEGIYQQIFSSSENYRNFLIYCKEHQYSFIEGEKNINIQICYFLLAFEQAKMYIMDGVKNDISKIISFGKGGVELVFANARLPGKESSSFISSLLKSIYHNISLNSSGEVIYIIAEHKKNFEVYSFESGIHFVDESGNVIDKHFINRQEREEMVVELSDKFKNLKLVYQCDFSEEDSVVFGELVREYEHQTGHIWEGKKIDILRFRFWVAEEYRQTNLMFDILKAEDTRSRDVLNLVGGTDLED